MVRCHSSSEVSSEDGVVLLDFRHSDLAAEIESNTCPICFELMKSPDFPPIVLSPCGHSFCAKCLSIHVGSQRKKPCPYCRQKIASSAVNLSLQRLIDNFVNLQDKRHQSPQPQTEHDKEHFLNKLSAAETRSEILQNELVAAVERKRLLESEMSNINGLHTRLRHKQAEARERLWTVLSMISIALCESFHNFHHENKCHCLIDLRRDTSNIHFRVLQSI